jgi:hypothetical protein
VVLGATAVALQPYNGNGLVINGVAQAIPSAGVLLNSGSLNVASTLFRVYAFMNGTTMTLTGSTGTHVTSSTAGNVGTEILNGDDTRSLVGMVFTNASKQFQDDGGTRYVASWFNRRTRYVQGADAVGARTTSASLVDVTAAGHANFVIWGDENDIIAELAFASVTAVGNGNNVNVNIGLDGTSTKLAENLTNTVVTGGQYYSGGTDGGFTGAAEGNHFLTYLGSVSGGTGKFFGAAATFLRI